MGWTAEEKVEAALRAPMSRAMLRPDTRVIERAGWYQLVTPSAPGTMLNEVLISQVAPDDADRAIEEVIATYAAVGHPVKWCVGPWTRPADLGDRLARRGFSSWEVRGMASATSTATGGREGVDEVGEEDVEAFVAATVLGWSLPPEQTAAELATHRAALRASPRQTHFFAARVGHEIVGTTGLLLRGQYAYLFGAQVFPAFRGRGLYRALVAARLAFLAARGVSLAVTQARAATSAPILERLGFETVFRSRCYLLELPVRA
ncbi:MAG TPA: GNAT family N-acetyltransferase [Kofleriaceae bacterium]|nr:GNAT family N-acetyltransferase [Kofleriaceae bacterium]